MPDFSDDLQGFVPVSRERMADFITRGLVIVDTNVLLDLYRYTSTARTELLETLGSLGDRLWIPHQVAFEFHRNRPGVIISYRESYSDLSKAIVDFRKGNEAELSKSIREFANRVSLASDMQEKLLGMIEEAATQVQKSVNDLQEIHGISERFISEDPVLSQLQELFENRRGARPTEQEMVMDRAEAERRVQEGIPPGFKDSQKDDPCGDYFVWRQMLSEAENRKQPLLFITRDGKSDWFQQVKGRTIGVLPELVEEARITAGVDFTALSTKSFLVHAKKNLNSKVSDATLKESASIGPPRIQRKSETERFVLISHDLANYIINSHQAQQQVRLNELTKRRAYIAFLRQGSPVDETELRRSRRLLALDVELADQKQALYDAVINGVPETDGIRIRATKAVGDALSVVRSGYARRKFDEAYERGEIAAPTLGEKVMAADEHLLM